MSRADELVELIRGRIHSEFDGECHLTDTEAHAIADFLSEEERRKNEARESWAFTQGDYVCKKSGSWWAGRVVGFYTTQQTPRGYAVQLDKPFGPVQIYPESALERFIPSEPHDAEGRD